jgi:hypothetical protein
MCLSTFAAAAVTFGLVNWLPAPPDEMRAFTKSGETTTKFRDRGDGRMCAVSVGKVGERVAFVAFVAGPPAGKPFPIPVSGERVYIIGPGNVLVEEGSTAFLDLPGGGRLRLPLRQQLIEVADGKLRCSNRRVTSAEVEAYLSSKHEKCCLDDLLRFVDARRKAAGK